MFNPDCSRRPAPDADRIRLGQRIETREAKTGEPSPQRLLAERAVEAIRAGKTLEEIHSKCQQADLFLTIEDKIGKDGKMRHTGFIKSGDGTGSRVSLWALPKDCSAYSIMKRTSEPTEVIKAPKVLTANSAKYHARAAFNASGSMEEAESKLAEKGMSIERQGKTGGYLRFAEGDEGRIKLSSLGGKYSLSALSKRYTSNHIITYVSNMHENQGKVNELSYADASKVHAGHAQDRASSAQERAVAIAGEAVQAKSIMEALDDGEAQAFALDAARRASAAAAKATARAQAAEERERALRQQLAAKTEQEATGQKTAQTTATATTDQSTNIDVLKSEKEIPGTDIAGNETALKTNNSSNINSENKKMETYIYQHDRKAFVHQNGSEISLDSALRDHALERTIRTTAGFAVDENGTFNLETEDKTICFQLHAKHMEDVADAIDQRKAEEFDLKKHVSLDLCSGPVSGTTDTAAAQGNAPTDGPRLR